MYKTIWHQIQTMIGKSSGPRILLSEKPKGKKPVVEQSMYRLQANPRGYQCLLLCYKFLILLPLLFRCTIPFQEGSSPSKIQGPVMGVEVTPNGGVTAHTLQQEPRTIQQQVQPQPNRPKEEVQLDHITDKYYEFSEFGSETFKSKYFTTDFYEYENNDTEILVKSRLKKNLQFWENIGAYPFILNVIEHGYKIPFESIPPKQHNNNNKSALENKDFVSKAIQELLHKNLIVQCDDIPHIVSPLSVAKNRTKLRLILDLSRINKFIKKNNIKYEDWKTALTYIQPHYWLVKFDIHSAYHHIDIYEPHTTYLGFSWKMDNVTLFYKFTVLPFGITSAPFIFTKTTKPLVKKWRSQGKSVLMYLDDGLIVGETFSDTEQISLEIKNDLINSGFVPKVEKCTWTPSQQLEWLGLEIDTVKFQVKVSKRRIDKAIATGRHIITMSSNRKRRAPVKSVASFVGQIISMSMVQGNLTQLMTRHISMDIILA